MSIQTHHCETRFCPAATRAQRAEKAAGSLFVVCSWTAANLPSKVAHSLKKHRACSIPQQCHDWKVFQESWKGYFQCPSLWAGKGFQGGLEREVCHDTEDKQCLNGRVWKTISQGQAVRHDRAFNEWAVIKCLVIFSSVFPYAFDFCMHLQKLLKLIYQLVCLWPAQLFACLCKFVANTPQFLCKILWENPGMTA